MVTPSQPNQKVRALGPVLIALLLKTGLSNQSVFSTCDTYHKKSVHALRQAQIQFETRHTSCPHES